MTGPPRSSVPRPGLPPETMEALPRQVPAPPGPPPPSIAPPASLTRELEASKCTSPAKTSAALDKQEPPSDAPSTPAPSDKAMKPPQTTPESNVSAADTLVRPPVSASKPLPPPLPPPKALVAAAAASKPPPPLGPPPAHLLAKVQRRKKQAEKKQKKQGGIANALARAAGVPRPRKAKNAKPLPKAVELTDEEEEEEVYAVEKVMNMRKRKVGIVLLPVDQRGPPLLPPTSPLEHPVGRSSPCSYPSVPLTTRCKRPG